MTDHRPSRSRYLNGCRCDGCREANAIAIARQRANRLARVASGELAMPPCRAGSTNNYSNYGCRCDICRDAQAKYMRDWYAKSRRKRGKR